jgi:hypothetical protein
MLWLDSTTVAEDEELLWLDLTTVAEDEELFWLDLATVAEDEELLWLGSTIATEDERFLWTWPKALGSSISGVDFDRRSLAAMASFQRVSASMMPNPRGLSTFSSEDSPVDPRLLTESCCFSLLLMVETIGAAS